MILSVSRRTDIPAFYSEWFYNRVKAGYVYVRNPYNKNLVSKISIDSKNIDCIVFWTKNPEKFIIRLDELEKFKYYFQFTINPYDQEFETNVPRKKGIIDTFKYISEKIGRDRIIWRYDPIFITEKVDLNYHIKYFEILAELLYKHTNKCIISFFDRYKKCERNLINLNVNQINVSDILILGDQLKFIANNYNLELETCAEDIELKQIGINHGRCIDHILIEKLLGKKLVIKKDKAQRESCGCVESIDIGEYNTCQHFCLYCYANYNIDLVKKNTERHNPNSPLLIGDIKENDKLIERETKSLISSNNFIS